MSDLDRALNHTVWVALLFAVGLDFLMINLLHVVPIPRAPSALFVPSLLSAALSSFSFFWTIAKAESSKNAGAKQRRFSTVAPAIIVSSLANTSCFLFLCKYIGDIFQLEEIVKINFATLGGCVPAAIVNYLGHRVATPGEKRSDDLLADITPSGHSGHPRIVSLVILSTLALVVRLLFVRTAPVAFGDAIQYNWIAQYIVTWQFEKIDTYWYSLFPIWEAGLALSRLAPYHTLVLSSLIPGVLLLLPVYRIADIMFGQRVALIASFATAFHPRLVEYSVSGHNEMFYLCCLTSGLSGLIAGVAKERPSKCTGIVTGAGLASAVLVRNEALLLVIPLLTLAMWKALQKKSTGFLLTALIFFGVEITTYMMVNESLLGSSGILTKSYHLRRHFSEQLEPDRAAREVYSDETMPQNQALPSTMETLKILAARFPRNLLYTIERLPGILLSPLPLFIPFMGFTRRRDDVLRTADSLLWAATLFPLFFYPLTIVLPRYLLMSAIGLQIIGSSGVWAFLASCSARYSPRRILAGTAVLIAVTLLSETALVAWNSEQERGYHRDVGKWIQSHLPSDARITGDGFGYVLASTFWARNHGRDRIWTDTAQKLAAYAKSSGQPYLILYEEYLRKANPELLHVLDEGIPVMKLLKQYAYPRVGRIQIYKLISSYSVTPQHYEGLVK